MRELLRTKISSSPEQRITYADYIFTALYDKEKGYYMNKRTKVGREGDFITTSNIGNIYGILLARWFFKQVSNGVISAAICEIGAGTGKFAKAFLKEWNQITDIPLTYSIVEASPYHKQMLSSLQQEYPVKLLERLSDIGEFRGLIFSNELFDALPVHVVEKRDGRLFEVMVSMEGERLNEVFVPLTDKQIKSYISTYEKEPEGDQRIEIPLAMEEMIRGISSVLVEGIFLTVDYGYTDEEWQEPSRKEGSLRGYFQHQMVTNVLQSPGEMDITTHVQWNPFIRIGTNNNLKLETFVRQDEFFLSIGVLDLLENNYDPNPFSEKSRRNRAIRSLITPGGISSHFQVVMQSKSLRSKIK